MEAKGLTSFALKSGVRQGCAMSGFLFSPATDWVMRKAHDEGNTGLRWRFAEKLDQDFADDIALLPCTRRHLQLRTDSLFRASNGTGLKININRTKVIRFNTVNDEKVMVNLEQLEDVDSFVSLGVKVTTSGGADDEIIYRMGKAKAVFGVLMLEHLERQPTR